MNQLDATTIQHNVATVQAIIAAACARVGRLTDEVTLVAVSKQQPIADIVAALEAGISHFGENRVEETQAKIAALQAQHPYLQPIWHMIGHVQSRKAREVATCFHTIHSLDSLKLAARLNQFANETNRTIQAYIQVNISGEDTKSGFEVDQWAQSPTQRDALWTFVTELEQFSILQTLGLMTMAPYTDDPEASRPVFVALRHLRDALSNDFPTLVWDHLSMGMTNDYAIAIEEGATLVRVGRAIFGERTY